MVCEVLLFKSAAPERDSLAPIVALFQSVHHASQVPCYLVTSTTERHNLHKLSTQPKLVDVEVCLFFVFLQEDLVTKDVLLCVHVKNVRQVVSHHVWVSSDRPQMPTVNTT